MSSIENDQQRVQNNKQHNKATILVVEDDDSIGSMLMDVLSQETSYNALRVTDALQALQAIDRVKPSLFITDYHLPRMNGLELSDRVRATQGLDDVPIIMISSFLPVEEEVQKRQLVSLSKPFDLDVFLDTVNKLLSC